MPDYLLDTNAISDLMDNHSRIQARIAGCTGGLMTSVVVWAEIEFGLLRLVAGPRRSQLGLQARTAFARMRIESVSMQTAAEYARIRRAVQLARLTVPDNDLWIAATALSVGAVVVTRDAHFAIIPGLLSEDWTL